MIGVRNNAGTNKDIVVWVNELRLSGFNESGGWAARANVNLAISDIATVNFGGHIETCGFGGIDQSLNERRLDDYYQYNIATMVDVGRFLPEKLKLKAPIFYSLSEERTLPKYNPLDQDILLSDALDAAGSDAERDSIKNASIDISTVKSFSISGLTYKVKIRCLMIRQTLLLATRQTSKISKTRQFYSKIHWTEEEISVTVIHRM